MLHLNHIIDGVGLESASPETCEVVSPFTGRVIARIPAGCPQDADAAVASARAAQPEWAALDLAEREQHLIALADVVERNVRDLAESESSEMGKPLALAEQFITGGVAALRASIELARTYPFVADVTVAGESSRTTVLRQPVGVVALIVPWNFTVMSVLGVLGPLLLAGNTVVIKPSEKSPVSAAGLIELSDLPPGVVNLLQGDRRAGQPLVEHEGVDLVHFTGSVGVGRSVGEASAKRLTRSILELGGNDPVIVAADVDDVAATARAVAFSSFINSGQICTSSERIYVHRSIAAEFTRSLVEAAGAFPMILSPEGAGLGPLVDDRQRQIVHGHVMDAVALGATAVCGGELPEGDGYFYPATVLVDVPPAARILSEETFGPVAPVMVFDTFDEAIALANGTRFGLAATVYTSDGDNLRRCQEIRAAIVWVNEWQGGGAGVMYEPWGESGSGATGGVALFDAATRPMSVIVAG